MSDNFKQKKLDDYLKYIIIALMFIFAGITFFFQLAITEHNFLPYYSILLNLLVLIFFLFAIKSTSVKHSESAIQNCAMKLGINSEDNLKDIVERSNEIIKQLVFCIKRFIIMLICFYVCNLFIEWYSKDFTKMRTCLEYFKLNSFLINLKIQPCENVEYFKYLLCDSIANFFNFNSGLAALLGFIVLFNKTIEVKQDNIKNTKQNIFKKYIYWTVFFSITYALCVSFIYFMYDFDLLVAPYFTRLITGIIIGVCMLLLFSRFINMEYFFKITLDSYQRDFFYIITILILPTYVIVQPLYGVFDIVDDAKYQEYFKPIIFLICFLGKTSLLLFLFTIIGKKWIHAYLIMVLSQRDTIHLISTSFDDIDDLSKSD